MQLLCFFMSGYTTNRSFIYDEYNPIKKGFDYGM